MKKCLIIIGASSHVLTEFKPTKTYDYILLSKKSIDSPKPKFMVKDIPIDYFTYDLINPPLKLKDIYDAAKSYSEIDIIYSAYSPTGISSEDTIESISLGLLANCAQPLYFLTNLSKSLSSKRLNAVFISSMYARLSPDPRKYAVDSQINPLYYGVAKAGVEQGLRWLSTVNTSHSFNAISLGPMPKKRVQQDSPHLIASLIDSMPSGKLVEHKELHSTINFLLSQSQGSLRGSTIHLDGGYGIL